MRIPAILLLLWIGVGDPEIRIVYLRNALSFGHPCRLSPQRPLVRASVPRFSATTPHPDIRALFPGSFGFRAP